MTRVLFTLTMPGRNTWNGKWSGDERNHTIVRAIDNRQAAELFATEYDHTASKSWSYSWSDGWCACVEARIIAPRERLRKSDGFCGYDWMVASILQYGKIYAAHERPAASKGTQP